MTGQIGYDSVQPIFDCRGLDSYYESTGAYLIRILDILRTYCLKLSQIKVR